MKTEKTSGFSARVKRWTGLMNLGLLGGVLVAASVQAQSQAVLVAECIPMNDRFVGPLRPLVRQIIGGIGGLIPMLVSILLILAIALGLFKVFRNEDASGVIKGFVGLLLVVLGGIAVLILVNAVLDVFNNMCSQTYF